MTGSCTAQTFTVLNNASPAPALTIYGSAYTSANGTPAALTSAPVASGTGNWKWMRVSFDGLTGYIPILY